MSATTTTLLTSSLRHLAHLVSPHSYSQQLFGQQSCLAFTKTVWLHLPGPESLTRSSKLVFHKAEWGEGKNTPQLQTLGFSVRSLWLAENITRGIICKPRATRAKSTLATVSHQPYHLSCSTSKSSDAQPENKMSKDFRINPERRDSAAFPFQEKLVRKFLIRK